MLKKIATVMAALGMVAAASGTAEAALGGCHVKVNVNNKCGHKVALHYVNFWHKSPKNKYSIPTIGMVVLEGGKSKTWAYDVLMACKTKKKVEVKYGFSGKGPLINKTSSLIDEALNPALRLAFGGGDEAEGLNPFLIGMPVVGLDTSTYDKSKDKYGGTDTTTFFPQLTSDWQWGGKIELNLTRCKY